MTTGTPRPPNKQINIKAFARNQCSIHSAVHEPMSLLRYNMKFPVSCSRHCASKTPFAFMDFLPAPCICVSCSCFGENRISIHSLYPFHLHHSLDRGPLESVPLTQKPFTMGRRGCQIGPGHLSMTLWTEWIQKEVRIQSYMTLPNLQPLPYTHINTSLK